MIENDDHDQNEWGGARASWSPEVNFHLHLSCPVYFQVLILVLVWVAGSDRFADGLCYANI